jgi:hypothetical protein
MKAGLAIMLVLALGSCGGDDAPSQSSSTGEGSGTASGPGASEPGDGPDATGATSSVTTGPQDDTSDDEGPDTGEDTGPAPAQSVMVHLVPQAGVAGAQRINFAVPLWPGALADAADVRVEHEGSELATYARALASHGDGSVRSVQIQIEIDVVGETDVEVHFGTPAPIALDPVAVADTLVLPDGTEGPRVWALLPAAWLADSGVAGPQLPESDTQGSATAWATLCDEDAYGIDAFVAAMGDTGSWLYDRGTALYRGYVRSGAASPLQSAYRETAIYVAGSTGRGVDVQIPVPGAADDLKYHYAQHAAIHYLLTGDDRFREYAEDIAARAHDLWGDPGYAGGADFWTERHAGFALLAYVWAGIVSDDRGDVFAGWADEAVTAYVAVQDGFPPGYDDPDARCFAHTAEAHGEDFGYVGCSPWMSAILADGLDAYARERDGAAADTATNAIVELGRIVARDGLDGEGRPYYWMGVGGDADEIDPYEEHWGESAYVVAMAWHWDGRGDAELRAAADALVEGFATLGEIGQLRSFNWQCRSAVATPWYLE